jgi:hypothetical protein
MGWGIQPPEGVDHAWGARAIFRGGIIDIVWDRQGGGDDDLRAWLNARGIPQIRRMVADVGYGEDREVRWTEGAYTIVANPKSSYGYLYLGAWRAGSPALDHAPLPKAQAMDVKCPKCGAASGEPCRSQSGTSMARFFRGEDTPPTLSRPHRERQVAASQTR